MLGSVVVAAGGAGVVVVVGVALVLGVEVVASPPSISSMIPYTMRLSRIATAIIHPMIPAGLRYHGVGSVSWSRGSSGSGGCCWAGGISGWVGSVAGDPPGGGPP